MEGSAETSHITFSNNATGTFNGGIAIAEGAFANVNVRSGSHLTAGNLSIATVAYPSVLSEGMLTISDPDSSVSLTPGSTLTIGHASFGAGTLNVNNGASLSVGAGGTTTLNATGTINVDGGAASLQALVDNGGTVNFNGGALSFLGHATIGSAGIFGGDLALLNNHHLTVSEITTVHSLHSLTLDGGSLSTGALVANGRFDFQRGTLGITGAFGLTIGGGGTFGTNLMLRDGQTLNVTHATTINAGSLLVVESGAGFTTGSIANSGELVLDGLAAAAISSTMSNSGLIRGEGRIVGNVTNATGGEIRAEAGKRLKLQGTNGTNAGKINLQGGTAEFTQALTNGATGQILGRGALSVGGTGLNNQGHVAFSSGITDVFGDVVNNTGDAARGVTVSGNADITFWDDVNNVAGSLFRVSAGSSATFFGAFSGAGISGFGDVYFEADVTPGASPTTPSFGGNVSFGSQASLTIELGGTLPGGQYDQLQVATVLSLDGALEVSLIGGFSPSVGQSFDILDWEKLNGTFASISLPDLGPLQWDTSQLYTTGVLAVVAPGVPGDYNQNGTVDAADYVVWRKGLGTIYTQNGYNTWRANFGRTAGSGTTAGLSSGVGGTGFASDFSNSLSNAVPEPSGAMLAMALLSTTLFMRGPK
jgi:hypothetical protein